MATTGAPSHGFLAASTLLSLGSQFLCGWLNRRWRYPTLLAVALLLYALSLAALPLSSRHWHLAGLAAGLGIAGGMIIVIFFSVWGDLFGQRHLGRILGIAQMITVLYSALGPVIFAASATQTGSYTLALWTMAGVSLLLGAATSFVREPNRSTN